MGIGVPSFDFTSRGRVLAWSLRVGLSPLHMADNRLVGNLTLRRSATVISGRASVRDADFSAKWKVPAGSQWTLARFTGGTANLA
jgi:hypothetical protein